MNAFVCLCSFNYCVLCILRYVSFNRDMYGFACVRLYFGVCVHSVCV